MSNWLHLPTVIHFVSAISPSRILDIGVGNGTYGFMLRQSLDISHERLRSEDWKITIDGVEIFPDYRNPVWDYAYNKVYIGDVTKLLEQLGDYDVILCNDVLEHFDHDQAIEVFETFLSKCRALIVTTPNIELPQDSWGGNEAERHRCMLRKDDFSNLIAWKRTGITNCYVCSKNPEARVLIENASVNCPLCQQPNYPLCQQPRAAAFVARIKRVLRGPSRIWRKRT
jgi:hypothetical protein